MLIKVNVDVDINYYTKVWCAVWFDLNYLRRLYVATLNASISIHLYISHNYYRAFYFHAAC